MSETIYVVQIEWSPVVGSHPVCTDDMIHVIESSDADDKDVLQIANEQAWKRPLYPTACYSPRAVEIVSREDV